MNATTKRDVCAYCGGDKELTVDHVPPKLLLEEPFPDNLITVPACVKCNKNFQRDDEYTRDMVALDFRAGANVAAASKVPKIFRSLQRPRSQRYASYVQGQLTPTELVDGFGRPLSLRASPDRDRIDATGKHIMLGMHFHFAKQPLPRDYQIYVCSKPGYDSIDFITEHFASLYGKAGDLVGYQHQAGGLNQVATVLSELAEKIDPAKLAAAAAAAPVPWAQRLGYLLERVGVPEKAASLKQYVRARDGIVRDEGWKLYVNAEVQPELIVTSSN